MRKNLISSIGVADKILSMNPDNENWWGDLLELSGDPLEYIEVLYTHFTRDFIDTKPEFEGQAVHHDKNDDGGKCACFVHITNKDDEDAGGRVMDLRRCERIGWIRPIIENHTNTDVLVWEEQKGKQVRKFLYLADERFLVILQAFKYGYLLVTAYHVDSDRGHQRFVKKHQRYSI